MFDLCTWKKSKNDKKKLDKLGPWPGPDRQRRQSFLSIGTYSWVFTDFSFLRRGARFFWRTCVEPWSLLRIFLLVMGVDENSGNSSPQLQNMKRKYSMKSLWLIWHLFCGNLGRKIRKLCVHFVRPLFFTLWSVFDVMFTKTPPKEWWIVYNFRILGNKVIFLDLSPLWGFSICSIFSKMLVLY